MISYILKEATKSKLFQKIHVSTNSEKIAEIINKLGYNVDFLRPDSLADDYTPLQPVIEYVLECYAKKDNFFDEVWLLLPCSPLIESNDLIKASDFISKENNSKKAIISVVEFPAPIDWAYEINKEGLLLPLNENKLKERSQDLKKTYYDSGTFMTFKIDNHSNKTRPRILQVPFLGYKISKLKGIDIDTNEDWEFVENLFRVLHDKNNSI